MSLLTIKEASEKLGIGQAAVYLAISQGRLRSVTRYGRKLVPSDALSDYEVMVVRVEAGRKGAEAKKEK
ncbi:MAG: helix-turn-helix domain-containing protein [Blastocatellia bacterium]|nr:helix-turn-helix domain-containing protein [Blastocatellia bacterium]